MRMKNEKDMCHVSHFTAGSGTCQTIPFIMGLDIPRSLLKAFFPCKLTGKPQEILLGVM